MISFDMHSRANLTPVPDFEKFKFFFKKNQNFQNKKRNFVLFGEILLFDLHPTANSL